MANGISLGALRTEIEQKAKSFSFEEVAAARDGSICPPYSLEKGGLYLEASIHKHYRAVPWATWEQVIRHYSFHQRPYVDEFRDCDEYARVLYGMASWEFGLTGVAFVRDNTGAHAYCLLLVRDGEEVKWLFFDPQGNQKVNSLGGRYQMKDGEINFG